MPDETHKLQEDPPEGSRETIDHELERQQKKDRSGEADGRSSGAGARQGRD